jgi:ABC-2 type transport system permease protein
VNVPGELAKLPAFVRRDVRIALSYRMAALGGLLALAMQAVVFSFIGKLVDPAQLPTFIGTRATYMEFVTIGIGLNMVVLLMVHQLATAIRGEQMIGTLESLLVTPTRTTTIQVGSATFELLYIPLRIGILVALIAILFGLDFHASGILPAVAIMISFLPFLWGLGLISAGAILTFRRGVGMVATGATILGLASGALFPLSLLPQWLQTLAAANPFAVALQGLRETLIGGATWSSVAPDIAKLVPFSLAAIVLGVVAFRLALRRERRNGTLGLY